VPVLKAKADLTLLTQILPVISGVNCAMRTEALITQAGTLQILVGVFGAAMLQLMEKT